MTDIASLAFRIDSTDAKRAKRDLEDLTETGARTERSIGGVTKAANENSAALGLNRAQFQELVGVARHSFDQFAAGGSVFQIVSSHAASLGEVLGMSSGGVSAGMVLAGGAAAVAAAGIGGLVFAFVAGREEAKRFADAVKATGDYTGITADAYQTMAVKIADASHGGLGEARKVLLDLVKSGAVTGEALQALAEDAVALGRLTGDSADKFAKAFGGMGQDVADFAEKFNSHYHQLTEAQLEHIRLLQETGQVTQAQLEFALDLHKRLGQEGPESLGLLEKAWRSVTTAIDGTWEAMKRVGNPTAQREYQLGAAQHTLDLLKAQQQKNPGAFVPGTDGFREIVGLEQQIGALSAPAVLGMNHITQAEQAAADAAKEHRDHWAKLGDNMARANEEIAKYRAGQAAIRAANPSSAELDSPARATDVENKIRAQYSREATAAGKKADEEAAKATRQAVEGQTAINRAIQDELSARVSATKDIQAAADIHQQELVAARDRLNDELDGKVRTKGISAADAERAKHLNNLALSSKELALLYATETAQLAKIISDRDQIAGYQQRELAARQSIAGTVSEANAIELQALTQRQALEASDLKDQLDLQLEQGAITQAKHDEKIAALGAAQGQEAVATLIQEQSRLLQEQVRNANTTLAAERAVLETQVGLAKTGVERRQIEVQLLANARQQEHNANAAAVEDPNSSIATVVQALTDMSTEGKRFGNQLKAINDNALLNDFQEMERNLSSMSGAIKAHDWASAFNDLALAIRQLQASAKVADGGLSKIGALAGIASGVGSIVGGTGGAAISGAASGAIGGASLVASLAAAGTIIPGIGNVAGALIGGAIGLIGGIFGGSSAKKQQEQQAAQQAAAAAAQHAAEVANTQAQLSVALLQAQGDALGAVNLQRQQEIGRLTALDPSLAAVQQQIYDLTDAADAAAKAAADAAQATADWQNANDAAIASFKTRSGLTADLYEAQGNTDQATAIRHQLALMGLDPQTAALQQQVWDAQAKAANDNAAASRAQAEATAYLSARQTAYAQAQSAVAAAANVLNTTLTSTRDKFSAFADSMKAFGTTLRLGPAAQLSPEAQYAATKAEFDLVRGLVTAPGADGDAARSQFQSAEQAYIDASKAYNASSPAYFRDLADVKAATEQAEGYARDQVSVAEQQLDAMNRQLGVLGAINDNVTDVAGAMRALAQAIASRDQLGTAMDPQWGAIQNAATNQQLAKDTGYTGAFGAGGFQAYITSGAASDAQRATARLDLMNAGQADRIQGFASGGAFTVGGSGGTDSQTVRFKASPWERVSITNPGQNDNGEMVAVMRDVRDLLRGLGAQQGKVAVEHISRLDKLVTSAERAERAPYKARVGTRG